MVDENRDYIKLDPYQEIIEGIRTSLNVNEGIIKLTGPQGSGKSALCGELEKDLREDTFPVVYFGSPPASADELQQRIAGSLGIEINASFNKALTDYLINREARKPLVLIFDDAEGIDDDTLQMIRLLSNIQDETQRLVRVVLSGSSQLEEKLESPRYRSLSQHINQSFELRPMDQDELEEFSFTLMRQLGLELHGLEDSAMRRIHRMTRGYPGAVKQLWNTLHNYREILPDPIDGKAVVHFIRQGTGSGPVPGKRQVIVASAALVLGAGISLWFFTLMSGDEPGRQVAIRLESEPVVISPPDQAQSDTLQDPVQAEAPEEPPAAGENASSPAQEPQWTAAVETPVEPEEEVSPETSIRDFLDGWTQSWQRQNLEAYFSHYHEYFTPLYLESAAAWRRDREEKIPAPAWIEISYDRLEVVSLQGDEATVRFWMNYDSPGYTDETLKELRLRRDGEAWRIMMERNLEVNVIR